MNESSINRFLLRIFIAVTLASNFPASAEEDGREVEIPDAKRQVEFNEDVLPILQRNCLACHNESETEGELILESVEAILAGGDSGPAIVSGDANESTLFQLAAHRTEPVMPPVDNDVGAKPLSPSELGLLKLWIDQGANVSEETDEDEIDWKKVPPSYAQIFALELSPDGHWLAAGHGNELHVYSVTGKREVERLTDETISSTHPDSAHLDVVQSIAWSPDQQTIVTGGFRCIKVWQRQKPQLTTWQPSDEDRKLLNDSEKDLETFLVNEDLTRLVKLSETKNGPQITLLELPSRKVLKTISPDIFHSKELAHQQRIVALAKERLRVAQADVEQSTKRKDADEKNTKKNEEDLAKAKAEVPKKKETLDKATAAKNKKQSELDNAKAELEAIEKTIADATDNEKGPKQDALKKAEELLKTRQDELKKAAEEEKKRRLELEGSQKVVKLGTEAVERAKKAVKLRAEELNAAEQEASQFQQAVEAKQTQLEATEKQLGEIKPDFSQLHHIQGGWQFATVDKTTDKIACFNFADGELISIHSGAQDDNEAFERSASTWNLVRTIGSSQEEVFADRVTALAYSHDGTMLATGGGEPSRTGEVTIWNTKDWSLVGSLSDLHSDVVYDLAFSPQDDTLASCASDRMMKTLDPRSAKPIRNFEGHTGHVLGVTWRADGRTLATAGADKVVKVWDAKEGTQKKTVNGFKSEVTAVRFLGLDDRFVFSTGRGKVESRDSTGKSKPGFAGFSDYVHKVSTDQNGMLVAAAGQDRVIRVWDNQGKLLVEFKPQSISHE